MHVVLISKTFVIRLILNVTLDYLGCKAAHQCIGVLFALNLAHRSFDKLFERVLELSVVKLDKIFLNPTLNQAQNSIADTLEEVQKKILGSRTLISRVFVSQYELQRVDHRLSLSPRVWCSIVQWACTAILSTLKSSCNSARMRRVLWDLTPS